MDQVIKKEVVGALKIASGRTIPGNTNWQPYVDSLNTNGISVDVDTKAAGFTGTPVYITSIGGNARQWETTGASAIYDPKASGFRIFIRFADGKEITPNTCQSIELAYQLDRHGMIRQIR